MRDSSSGVKVTCLSQSFAGLSRFGLGSGVYLLSHLVTAYRSAAFSNKQLGAN